MTATRRNKRISPRRNLKWVGLIVNMDGSIIGPFSAINVSATGAKISPTESIDLPNEFVLMFSTGGIVRRHCRIVWRSGKEVGVKFVSAH
jgi:hypothetical protein